MTECFTGPTGLTATLHCGDCIGLIQGIGADAIVTDPPYGHGGKWAGGTWATADVWKAAKEWDAEQSSAAHIGAMLERRLPTVIWGGNYYALPPSRCWLAWRKSNSVPTMADMELAWTSLDAPARCFDFRVNTDGERLHAAQKPVPLMAWCLTQMRIAEGATVLDPFMGSGTTGIACLRTGRNFVGIEVDGGRFKTACERFRKELDGLML